MPAAAPSAEYREVLWPSPWILSLVGGLITALSVAYGSAVGRAAGVAVAAAASFAGLLALRMQSPRLRVADGELRAGRAVLPLDQTGRVIPLEGPDARAARGAQGDPTAYVVSGAGSAGGAVVVEVTDPTDPHGTWLLTSRRPAELARAIAEARGSL